MEKLKFYSVAKKKSFMADDYKVVNKSGRRFAVAKYQGSDCYRILGKSAKK